MNKTCSTPTLWDMEAPILFAGRARLRPPATADRDDVAALFSGRANGSWITPVPAPCSLQDAEGLLTDPGVSPCWVLEIDGRHSGLLGLRPAQPGVLDLALVHSAAEPVEEVGGAVVAVVRWAREHRAHRCVRWTGPLGGLDAWRPLWTAGFTLDGRLRFGTAHGAHGPDAWTAHLDLENPLRPAVDWLDAAGITAPPARLRALADTDVDRIVEGARDPQTQWWLPGLPTAYGRTDALTYLGRRRTKQALGQGLAWGVCSEDEDGLRGVISVDVRGAETSDPPGSAEAGYWIHPQGRGHGLATAALRAVARHALLPRDVGGMGLDRLVVRVAQGNEASHRVASRCGLRHVGRERQAELLRDGTRVDMVCYDLLVAELPAAGDDDRSQEER